ECNKKFAAVNDCARQSGSEASPSTPGVRGENYPLNLGVPGLARLRRDAASAQVSKVTWRSCGACRAKACPHALFGCDPLQGRRDDVHRTAPACDIEAALPRGCALVRPLAQG